MNKSEEFNESKMILKTIEHAMKVQGKTWRDLEHAIYGKETRSLSQSFRKFTKRIALIEAVFEELDIEVKHPKSDEHEKD